MKLYIQYAVILIVGALLSGCTASKRYELAETIQYACHSTENTYSPDEALGDDLQRVAVLPMTVDCYEGPFAKGIEKAFLLELNKQQRFEVVKLKRSELKHHFHKSNFSAESGLPEDLVDYVEFERNAQAILFIEITHLRPYKPISMSVKARLVEIETGDTIWVVDEDFDSGHRRVARAAESSEDAYQRRGFVLDCEDLVFISPVKFAQYVAKDIFSTLPKRI